MGAVEIRDWFMSKSRHTEVRKIVVSITNALGGRIGTGKSALRLKCCAAPLQQAGVRGCSRSRRRCSGLIPELAPNLYSMGALHFGNQRV
jgi:hypothetical protein